MTDIPTPALRRHGMWASPAWKSCAWMMKRCYTKSYQHYHRYGGRGIKVCERWHDFKNFFEDMGERPVNKTLDRFPNKDGDYCKENCRWATGDEQANNKSTNVWLELNGEKKTISQWARALGISPDSVHARITAGWNTKDALLLPMARQWDANDIEVLETYAKNGKTSKDAAQALNRGHSTVRQFASAKGIRFRARDHRRNSRSSEMPND